MALGDMDGDACGGPGPSHDTRVGRIATMSLVATVPLTWVHVNGGVINGGVACVRARWRVLCVFACFLVRFCAFFPTEMACKKRRKALLCNTPFELHPLLRVTDLQL